MRQIKTEQCDRHVFSHEDQTSVHFTEGSSPKVTGQMNDYTDWPLPRVVVQA